MNIRVITASAGSGKTTKLSKVLDEAIGSGRVRPEAIVATTFTREAAAELVERARERLLASGRGREAHQLLAARIGTVNSVCGALVSDFAFELGLSPALRILDETAAQLEQDRALAAVVSPEAAERLHWFQTRFDAQLDWRYEVRKIIDASRANGIDAAGLVASAARSSATLDACLGPCEPSGDAIDDTLADAIGNALAAIDTVYDSTKGTAAYVELLEDSQREIRRGSLRWGQWAKLSKETPTKKSIAAANPVIAAARRHAAHPRLRAELHELIERLFAVAAAGLAAYDDHKRARGLIDFADQEALALELLRRPDVREALEGQLELVLVDEFQDTSPLQLAVFVELASLAKESVWVGDQKQAIYGFRGTDPALMDAVIESLGGTATDPELLQAAFEAAGQVGVIETLDVSYRSRPALVARTNEVFAAAFARQGIPEERTRLRPALAAEPAGLGAIVEHWPIVVDGRSNKAKLAGGAAAGVRELLRSTPQVRERGTGTVRAAHAGDVAVLCRTNEQGQLVADALRGLGVPAVVAQVGLLDTAEARVVIAGLHLWVDPRDALAAAEIVRALDYATDPEAFVACALDRPGGAGFLEHRAIAALTAARAAAPDLPPLEVIGAVIDVLDVRSVCAGWGEPAQRLANLDALRGHAVTYAAETVARREAVTLVGLLRYLESLVEESMFGPRRSDRQALRVGSDAVTVSTWHRAKGREWPITVLYGLETLREPVADGLHVVAREDAFDLARPLDGRWLRYWPHPYTTANQHGPVRAAYEASAAYAQVVARANREALRLLYVGWTRARDLVAVCAEVDKLQGGLLGTLARIDPALLALALRGAPQRPTTAVTSEAPSSVPGEVTVGLPPRSYPPARMTPSSLAPVACTVKPPIVLGPRLTLRGDVEMAVLGSAVHAFLAADDERLAPEARRALADGLLARFQVTANLDPADLVEAGTRMWRWLASLGPDRVQREWPVAERRPEGTLVYGTADLVVRWPADFAIVDHKSLPMSLDAALARLPTFSGQLAGYGRAISAASALPLRSAWIHLPLLGVVAELDLGGTPPLTPIDELGGPPSRSASGTRLR